MINLRLAWLANKDKATCTRGQLIQKANKIKKLTLLIALALLGCNSSDSKKEDPTIRNNHIVDIKITWQDNSDNEDEFIVSRRFYDEVEFTILDYLPESAVSYIDKDIDNSYNYCYKITASNDAGKSDSDEACTNFK